MQLSPDEFHAITCSPFGAFCNEDGEILFEQFEKLMRHQLIMYVQRQLALGSEHEETRCSTFSTSQVQLQGLQMLVLSMEQQLSALQYNEELSAAKSPINADSSSRGATPSQYTEKEIQAIFELNVDKEPGSWPTAASRGVFGAVSQLLAGSFSLICFCFWLRFSC